MTKNKLTTVLFLSFLPTSSWADNFDDAVNLYLKGVEQCIAAKEQLASRNLITAQRAFGQYEEIKKQAAELDSSILTSNQRGMNSNLKFCKRIGNDIELANGTPILEQAMVACEQAFNALRANTPTEAQAHFQEYVQYRDQALEVAPGLTDVFSLKSDISRCNRLENKIAKSGKHQALVTQLLESATDESEAMLNGCKAANKEFKDSGLGKQSLESADKSLSKLENYRKNAQEYYRAYQEKEPAGNTAVANNLKQGEQCIASFKTSYSSQQEKWTNLTADLERQKSALISANNQCADIAKLSAGGPDRTRHEKAKSQYDAARRTRSSSQKALGKNQIYTSNADAALTKQIDNEINTLNQCIKKANKQVAALAPVPAAPVAVASAAAATVKVATAKPALNTAQAPAPTGQPASKLTGTLVINDTQPEIAILYWEDGKSLQDSSPIRLYSTGFSNPVYIVPQNGQVQIENNDFAQHKLTYSHPQLDVDKPLISLGSKQRKTAEINLPDHSLSIIRSNKGRVTPSYLVKAPSSDIKVLQFEAEGNSLDLELVNPNAAQSGYLLIPDMAPVAFTLSKGSEASIDLIRNNTKIGTLNIKGN